MKLIFCSVFIRNNNALSDSLRHRIIYEVVFFDQSARSLQGCDGHPISEVVLQTRQMARSLSNPLFKNSRLTKEQTELLVSEFCFDYQGAQIARVIGVSQRSMYDQYLRLKIRQVEDPSVTNGLPVKFKDLPEADDPVWQAIRQCLIYCENRILKQKHRKTIVNNFFPDKITEVSIDLPEFYPDPCKECPIGKARASIHPYLIHEFRSFANRRRRVTTKFFKYYSCDRMIKSACFAPGSLRERDRLFELYVRQLLESLRRRPLGGELARYLKQQDSMRMEQ